MSSRDNCQRWIIHHSDPDLDTETIKLEDDLWPKTIESAIEHGVLFIIFDNLQKRGIRIPPAAHTVVMDYLILQSLKIDVHKRFLGHLGKQIKKLPDFVIMKGVALATQLYSDPSHRPAGDIDILIKREDYSFWFSYLKEMGFAAQESGSKDTKFLRINKGPFNFSICIELHWELFTIRKRNIWADGLKQMWENREFVFIDGEMIPVMGPRVLLPYLSIHLLLHRHYRLEWVIDILLLMRKHSQNLLSREYLNYITSDSALRRYIYYSCHYAYTLFELPEMTELMSQLRHSTKRYCYIPLLREEEFINNKAIWAGVKIKIIRDTFEIRWSRKLKRSLRLFLCYILEILKMEVSRGIRLISVLKSL